VRFAAEQRGSILAAAFATGETAYAALAGVSAPPSKHEEGSSPGPVEPGQGITGGSNTALCQMQRRKAGGG